MHLPQTSEAYGRTTDSVIYLEVAEHLPASKATVFLDTLTRFCDEYLVISWAVKGQGGRRHVNEQDEDYVVPALTRRSFEYCPDVAARLRSAGGQDLSWFARSVYAFHQRGG